MKKKGKSRKRVIQELQTFSFVAGQLQNKVLAPHRYTIMQGTSVLSQLEVIEQPKSNFTTNKCAEIYLYGVNCIVSTEKSSFSLIEHQTDKDYKFIALGIMQNMALKNQQILLYDKFIDPCDPIYNLDDNRPFNVIEEAEKNKNKKGNDKTNPDLIKVAYDFVSLNTSVRTGLAQYWANNHTEIMRNKI